VNADQVRLVERSATLLLAQPYEWSSAFYDAMFAADPSARSLFPDDMAAQREKFIGEISVLLSLVADLDAFDERAAALGAAHVAYGVHAAHYRLSGEALVASAAVILGEDATPEVLDAWRAVHDLVAEAMQGGALAAPPPSPV
jgi:hemoglobin-like flavoprotein